MDGVYLPDDAVTEGEVERIRYFIDHMETKNVLATIDRNKRKGEVLFKLRKTGKIHDIPYKIYYNACNLEHVLYNELRDFTDAEKEELSDDFAERYEGKVNEFIEFISASDVAVSGTYQQTWNYIEKDKNSSNRHSNMHLIFQK